MLYKINQADLEGFVSAFMSNYRSPGLNIKNQIKAYNKPVEIIEFRNSYRVKVNKKIKRFRHLYLAAEFIFLNTYDFSFIYLQDIPYRKLLELGYTERKSKKRKAKNDESIL